MFNELKKEGEIKNRMKRSNILLVSFTSIRLARDKEVSQYQVLQRMKISGNPYTLLMRIYIDSITLESNLVLAYKVYHSHTLLLLLLLLSRLSRVRLCATPQTAAHQASPSLGFSRQEYRSGLPFPSPMRESEVAQSYLILHDPMVCSLPGSSVMGFSRQEYRSEVPLPSPHILYHLTIQLLGVDPKKLLPKCPKN